MGFSTNNAKYFIYKCNKCWNTTHISNIAGQEFWGQECFEHKKNLLENRPRLWQIQDLLNFCRHKLCGLIAKPCRDAIVFPAVLTQKLGRTQGNESLPGTNIGVSEACRPRTSRHAPAKWGLIPTWLVHTRSIPVRFSEDLCRYNERLSLWDYCDAFNFKIVLL